MAYDEVLAARVRKILSKHRGITEQKMFGGLAFMLYGNMCCGVVNDDLVLRLGEEGAADALVHSHTRLMDFTGKPMKTMVYVGAQGLRDDAELRRWLIEAVAYVSTLRAK